MMPTVLELKGTPCVSMEAERTGRDQLIFSRSFSTPITTAAGLCQVMGVYAQMASARLAKHDLQAKVLTAFAATSQFKPNEKVLPLGLPRAADTHRAVCRGNPHSEFALTPPHEAGSGRSRARLIPWTWKSREP